MVNDAEYLRSSSVSVNTIFGDPSLIEREIFPRIGYQQSLETRRWSSAMVSLIRSRKDVQKYILAAFSVDFSVHSEDLRLCRGISTNGLGWLGPQIMIRGQNGGGGEEGSARQSSNRELTVNEGRATHFDENNDYTTLYRD